MALDNRFIGGGGGRGPRGKQGPPGPPGPPGPGGGGSLQINAQTVVNNGDTVFVAPGAAVGSNVLMYVNGVLYEQGVDYSVAVGVNTTITWNNVPFLLSGGVPGPADRLMFIYWV